MARAVLAQASHRWAEHLDIECYDYRQETFHSRSGFQEQVPDVGDYDIVVGIVWKRLGTPLDPARFPSAARAYGSGTQYEIETALDAAQQAGRPEVAVFRKQAPVQYEEDDAEWQIAQHKALKAWWADCFGAMGQAVKRASTSFPDTDAFGPAFERWLERWLRDTGAIPAGPSWRIETDGSPYPGLTCYDARTARVFRGRDASLRRALGVLRRRVARGEPSLFVVGPSGSGKSSFVRAGLVPRLTMPGGVDGVSVWRVAIIEPGTSSLVQLATTLYSQALPELSTSPQPTPDAWAALAGVHPDAAAQTVAWALASSPAPARLLLVVDQLESLVTGSEAAGFTPALHALRRHAPVVIVATLRSNRYALLQEDPQLADLRGDDGVLDLPPPGPEALRDIIDRTAADAGLVWDRAADGRMLNEVLAHDAGSADALPLVQMALHRLFEQRDAGNRLTCAAYSTMGGLSGAIGTLADATVAALPAAAAEELDALLRSVVSESDAQGSPTLRSVPRDWASGNADRELLLQSLVSARLLVDDAGHVRVAHEALLRQWPRARDSAALRPESLRLTRALAPLVAAWQSSGAADDLTLSPALLSSAVALLEEAPAALDPSVSLFVRAVERRMAAQGEAELAQARAREWVATARYRLAHAPDEALALAIKAYEAAPLDDARHVLRQTVHAARCRAIMSGAPVRDAVFAPGSRTLITVDIDGRVQLWDAGERAWRRTLAPATSYRLSVARLEFDASGRWLALSRGNELTLFDWPSGTEVGRASTHGGILSLAFDTRSERLVVTHGATVEMFSVPALIQLDRWHLNYVVSAEFSSDNRHVIGHWDNGSLLAIWSIEQRKVVWSVRSPGERPRSIGDSHGRWRVLAAGERAILTQVGSDGRQQLGPDGAVAAVVWIDADAEFALAHANGTISIWRVNGPSSDDPEWQPIASAVTTLSGHRAGVSSLAWSAERRLLASGGEDGSMRLWHRTPEGMMSPAQWNDGDALIGHGRRVWWLAFAPESSGLEALVSIDTDHELRLWDVGATTEVARSRLPVSKDIFGSTMPAEVERIATAADGSAVITIAKQRASVLSDDEGRTLATLTNVERGLTMDLPAGYRCNAASFSSDGRHALTLHDDGVAAVWRVSDGQRLYRLDAKGRPLMDVRFLPDGKTILGLNDRHRVLWWELGSAERKRLQILPRGCFVLAIDSDGQRLLIADREERMALWSTVEERIIAPLETPGEPTTNPRFSGDGHRVLLDGEAAGTLLVWTAATGAMTARQTINLDSGRVHLGQGWAYFKKALDEYLFIVSDGKGTAVLWDRRRDEPPRALRGHTGYGIVTALGPGGHLLATADSVKTMVWDVATAQPVAEFPAGASQLAISPDGRRVITVDGAGLLRWWCLDGESLLELAKKRRSITLKVPPGSGDEVPSVLGIDPET